eukprot:scpid23158/ scgid4539/ E3 ubiquitin-protein ligase TRIM56; Tripartite motif-containing protein 56
MAAKNAVVCVFCDTTDLSDAKFLHCLHVSCVPCLNDRVTTQGAVQCGICRRDTKPKFSGVHLRKQLVTCRSLLKSNNQNGDDVRAGSDDVQQCDFCEGAIVKPATHKCDDCDGAMLCAEHVQGHATKRVFRHHQVKKRVFRHQHVKSLTNDEARGDGGDAWTETRNTRCPVHSRYEVNRYCRTCDIVACEQCVVLSHQQQHTVVPLTQIAKTTRTALQQALPLAPERSPDERVPSSTQSVYTVLDMLKGDLDAHITKTNDDATAASKVISDTFSGIRSLLDKHEEELLKKVDTLRWKMQKPMESKLQRLTEIEQSNVTTTEVGKLLSSDDSSDIDVMMLGTCVLEKLKSFRSDIESEEKSMLSKDSCKIQTAVLSDVLQSINASVETVVEVFEDVGIDLQKMTVNVPHNVQVGKTSMIQLRIPCARDEATSSHWHGTLKACLRSPSGPEGAVTLEASSNIDGSDTLQLSASIDPKETGSHVLEVSTPTEKRSIQFQVPVSSHLQFDKQRCSPAMKITGSTENIASLSGTGGRNGNVYGTVAYTSGVHTWSVKVTGSELNEGCMYIGVATLPPDGQVDDSKRCAYNYGAGWNQPRSPNCFLQGGLTENARTGPWEDGDILTFTLDYDGGSLELCIQRTGERKSICGFDPQGKALFFCVTIWDKLDRMVEIVG